MNPYSVYLLYDDPIPYGELLLYPVTMRDYIRFHFFASCLLLEKNSIPDPKIISMSYLAFLYKLEKEHNPEKEASPLAQFDGLLRLVLKQPDAKLSFGFDENNKAVFRINDAIYGADDFEKIRDIIALQNDFELIDETIQKDVRDSLEEARKYKQRLSGNSIASLEEILIALAIYSGWEIKSMYDMSIRKFKLSVRRADHILNSSIFLEASLSGLVEFKDKSAIKQWLADLDSSDKYGAVTMSIDEMEDKISSVNGIPSK